METYIFIICEAKGRVGYTHTLPGNVILKMADDGPPEGIPGGDEGRDGVGDIIESESVETGWVVISKGPEDEEELDNVSKIEGVEGIMPAHSLLLSSLPLSGQTDEVLNEDGGHETSDKEIELTGDHVTVSSESNGDHVTVTNDHVTTISDHVTSIQETTGDHMTDSQEATGDHVTSSQEATGDHVTGSQEATSDHVTSSQEATSDHVTGSQEAASDHMTGSQEATSDHVTGSQEATSDHVTGSQEVTSDHVTDTQETTNDHMTGSQETTSDHVKRPSHVTISVKVEEKDTGPRY